MAKTKDEILQQLDSDYQSYVNNYNEYATSFSNRSTGYNGDEAAYTAEVAERNRRFAAEGQRLKKALSLYSGLIDEDTAAQCTENIDAILGNTRSIATYAANQLNDVTAKIQSGKAKADEIIKATQDKAQKAYDTAYENYYASKGGTSAWQTALRPDDLGSVMLDNAQIEKDSGRTEILSTIPDKEKWHESELNLYYYLLNNGNTDAASKYAKEVNSGAGSRYYAEQQQKIKDDVNANIFTSLASNIGSLGLTIAGAPFNIIEGMSTGVSGIVNDGQLTEAEKYTISPNKWQDLVRTATSEAAASLAPDWNISFELTDGVEVNLGNGLSAIYGIGYSMAQSRLIASTLGPLGTALLGLEAGTTAMNEAIANGATTDKALENGLTAGIFEMLFEYVSIDKLVKIKNTTGLKKILKNMLAQGGIEASEEFLTSLFNYLSEDVIYGDESDYQKSIRNYMANGMSEDTAVKQAVVDNLGELVNDAVGGFVSGFLMAGNSTVAQKIVASKQGKAINKAGATDALMQLASTYAENTEAGENLKAIQDAQAAGKKVSNMRIGQLYQALGIDAQSQNYNDAYNAAIQKGLSEDVAKAVGELVSQDTDGADLNSRKAKAAINTILSELDIGKENVATFVKDSTPETVAARSAALESLAAEMEKQANLSKANKSKAKSATQTTTEASQAAETAQATEPTTEQTQTETTEYKAEERVVKPYAAAVAEGKVAKATTKDGSVVYEVSNGDGTVTSTYNNGVKGNTGYLLNLASRSSMSQSAANLLIDAANTYGKDNLARFALGFEEVYLQSRYNQKLTGKGYSQDLSETAYNQARLAGMADRQADDAKRRSYVKYLTDANITTPKQGNVYIDKDIDSLTSRQRLSIKALTDIIAPVTKNNIYIYESVVKNGKHVFAKDVERFKAGEAAPNGFYNQATGDIYIDLNSGNNAEGVILWTAAHELTHDMRRRAPDKFNALAEFLVNEYQKHGVEIADLVERQQRKAAKAGRTLNYDEAYEEVVADSMQTMLTDTDLLSKLEKLKAQDKTLWQKIKDFFDKLFSKLKAEYEDLNPQSQEAAYIRQMKDSIEEISTLFVEGIVEAGENYTVAEITGEADIDGNPSTHEMSIRSVVEGAGLYFDYNEETGEMTVLDRKGGKKMTKVEVEDVIDSPLGNIVGIAQRNGNITAAEANKQYKFLTELVNICLGNQHNFTLLWEIAGTQVFSAIKMNSDTQYGKTIDFSTICKKTQQVINVISETQKQLKRGLTKAEIEHVVYYETGKAGEPTPCPVCYVFSRWMGIGGILQQMHDFQKKYDGVSEKVMRDFISDVELEMIQHANTPGKGGKLKADFFDKSGKPKFGTIIADLKAKATARINAANKALEKNATIKLQIQELETLLDKSDAKETKKISTSIAKLESKIRDESGIQKTIDEYEAKMSRYEEYQWLTKTYMDEVVNENGEHIGWKKDENFKPVDDDTLFDLREGARFATEYPKSWKYRTTKGCNAGKAILPYSDARVGEAIQGVAYANVKDIQIGETNAFLNGDQKASDEYVLKAIKKQLAQNLLGGMRYQSTSDFRYEYGSDYLITFLEMQAIGAKVQLYTKVIEAVDFLCTVGADVNLSVMPLHDGYIVHEDGRKQLMFSPVTGINATAAIAKTRQYDNAQLILVGISDEHIRLALSGDDVNGDICSFVIPFHGSGNTVKVIQDLMDLLGEQLDVTKAKDYSKVQSDHKAKKRTPEQIALWELRKKIIARPDGWDGTLTMKEQALLDSYNGRFLKDLYNRFYVDESAEEYGVSLSTAQAEQIFPYEYWDKTLTYAEADENGERFKQYCQTMGIIPRFSGVDSDGKAVGYGNFTNDKGYWKLLIDRKMYNNDGTYHVQRKINVTNFKIDSINPAWGSATYGDVMQKDSNPKKTNAIVKNVIAQLGNKFSDRDYFEDPSFVKLRDDNPLIMALYDTIRAAKQHFNTKEFDALYELAPRWDYIERLQNKDKTAKTELEELVNTITSKKLLEDMRWFIAQGHKNIPNYITLKDGTKAVWDYTSYKKTHTKGINDFRKIIDKRISEVGDIGGFKVNIKNNTFMSVTEIKDLFNKLNDNAEIASLAEKVFGIAETLNIAVKITDSGSNAAKYGQSDNLGYWHGNRGEEDKTGLVVYRTNHLNATDVTDGDKARTLLHEMIHACTCYAYYAQRFFPFEFDDGLQEPLNVLNNIYRKVLYSNELRTSEIHKAYGLKSELEFLAELSNPVFREQLSNLKIINIDTYIDMLVAQGELLGIDPNSKVESAALVTLDNLLSNFDRDLYEKMSNRRVYKPINVKYSDRDSILNDTIINIESELDATDTNVVTEMTTDVINSFKFSDRDSLSNTKDSYKLIGKDLMEYAEGYAKPDLTLVEVFNERTGKTETTIKFVGQKPADYVPKKIAYCYKLFEQHPDGTLHALFAGASNATPINEWVYAKGFPYTDDGVKGMNLRERYGWHLSAGLPSAPHLMSTKSFERGYPSKNSYGHPNGSKRVWVRMAYDASADFNSIADQTKAGDIFGLIPFGGYYAFKENNQSEWVISSAVKIDHILTEEERQQILKDAGYDEYEAWRKKHRATDAEKLENKRKSAENKKAKDKAIKAGLNYLSENSKAMRESIQSKIIDNPELNGVKLSDRYASMTEERIDYLIQDSGAGSRTDYARSWITAINPTDFLNMTLGESNQNRAVFDTMPGEYGSTVNDRDFTKDLKAELRQTPYLAIDIDTGDVIGHEGRHRMRALEKQGITKADIVVQFYSDGMLVKELNGYGNELKTIDSLKVNNQRGTGQTATLKNIIPINQANKDNILASYGDESADLRYSERDYSNKQYKSIDSQIDLENELAKALSSGKYSNKSKVAKDYIAATEQRKGLLNLQAKYLAEKKSYNTAELRKKYANRINTLNQNLEIIARNIDKQNRRLLDMKASKPLQDIVKRVEAQAIERAKMTAEYARAEERNRALKREEALVEKYRTAAKAGVESREATRIRNSIRNRLSDISRRLLKNADKNNVKQESQGAVASFLNSTLAMLDTVKGDERIANYANQIKVLEAERTALLDQRDQLIEDGKDGSEELIEIDNRISNIENKINQLWDTAERISGQSVKLNSYLLELGDSYQRIMKYSPVADDSIYQSVLEDFNTFREEVGNKSIMDMSLTELQAFDRITKELLHQIQRENKLFGEEKAKTLEEQRAVLEQEAAKRNKVSTTTPFKAFLDKYIGSLNKPKWFFKWLELSPISERFKALEDGELKDATLVNKAAQMMENAKDAHGIKQGDYDKKKTYSLDKGTFELSRADLLSIYAYTLNAETNERMKHGVSQAVNKEYRDENGKKKIRQYSDPIPFTANDIQKLKATLTTEEKAFVEQVIAWDALQKEANKASRALVGIDKFTVNNYFGMAVDPNYVQKDSAATDAKPSIANDGRTKRRIKNATAPIVIGDFFEMWAKNTKFLADYAALAVPIENFSRLMNVKTFGGEQQKSIRDLIASVYGQDKVAIIDNLLRDANGGLRADPSTGIGSTLISMYKKDKVALNLSSASKQYSAIMRYLSYIDTKYLMQSYASLKALDRDWRLQSENWERLKKYSGLAIIKDIGKFDIGMGSSVTDYMLKETPKGIKSKTSAFFDIKDSSYRDDLASWLPERADRLAWLRAWDAFQRKVASENNLALGSEENLKEATRQWEEATRLTQNYDSTLSRPQILRSKDSGVKMATAFMGESMVKLNMLIEAKRQATQGNKKQSAKIIASVIAADVVMSLMAAVVAMWRDKDEDKTLGEKYIDSAISSIIEQFDIATLLPYIKDIESLADGYDISRTDTELFADAVDALRKFDYTDWESYVNLFTSAASFIGVPLKSLKKDITGIVRMLIPKSDGVFDAIDSGESNSPTPKQTYDKVVSYLSGLMKLAATKLGELIFPDDTTVKAKIFTSQYNAGNNDLGEDGVDTYISEKTHENIDSGKYATEADAKAAAISSAKSAMTSSYKELYYRAWSNSAYAGDKAKVKAILESSGLYVDDKGKSTVDETLTNWLKNTLIDEYKIAYIKAYIAGNNTEMQRIRTYLYSTKVWSKTSELADMFVSWNKQAAEKKKAK